jgi:hypothetical protein
MSLREELITISTKTYSKNEYNNIRQKCVDAAQDGKTSYVHKGKISDPVRWRLAHEGISFEWEMSKGCTRSWDYMNHTCSEKCGDETYSLSWNPYTQY